MTKVDDFAWGLVTTLVDDALLRFPNDQDAAIAYAIKHGPATLEAATNLIRERLKH